VSAILSDSQSSQMPILIAETENCLVEVARRECNHEHDPVDIQKP